MTAIRKRAVALENQFARDQELLFKTEARRNALIGLWAASVIGTGDGEAYARELAMTAVEGEHKVLERLRHDFDAAGVAVLDTDIQDRMVSMLRTAADDLYNGR